MVSLVVVASCYASLFACYFSPLHRVAAVEMLGGFHIDFVYKTIRIQGEVGFAFVARNGEGPLGCSPLARASPPLMAEALCLRWTKILRRTLAPLR